MLQDVWLISEGRYNRVKINKILIYIFSVIVVVIIVVLVGNQVQSKKVENYLNEQSYYDFRDSFLSGNKQISKSSIHALKQGYITSYSAATNKGAARRIESTITRMVNTHRVLYSNEKVVINRYQSFIMDNVYNENLKLLYRTTDEDKNRIEFDDSIISYFERIDFEEKLEFIAKTIEDFELEYQKHLQKYEKKKGEDFLKDGIWIHLFNELNQIYNQY